MHTVHIHCTNVLVAVNKNLNADYMCTCLYFVQVTGFLEKNRDGLKPDLEDLISRCGNKVHYVFLNCC